MQYYNSLVKMYKPEKGCSLRVLYYPDLQKRAEKERFSQREYNNKLYKEIEEAEDDQELQAGKERDYKQEAIARTKRTIKEIIRINYSDRLKMITLTYKEKCDDHIKVLNDIKNMNKRYKEHYDKDLRYIATLEWQKERGSLHVHMIVDSFFIPATTWAGGLWLQGNIKINTITYNKKYSECLQAIEYVMKYITKDMNSHGFYNHLYFRSRNWEMYVLKKYDILKGEQDVFSLALLYLGTPYHSTIKFEWEDWKGDKIIIYDFYS